MTYTYHCKKCGYTCESITKDKRREAELAHKVRRADGTWACAQMMVNLDTGVKRRAQIVP